MTYKKLLWKNEKNGFYSFLYIFFVCIGPNADPNKQNNYEEVDSDDMADRKNLINTGNSGIVI